MAREEALSQLQWERAALEGAWATLKQQQEEVSRLNGELVQISILHEDQRQSLEEQEASVLKLQCQAEEARQSLEGEKKQVEGEFTSTRLLLVNLFFLGFAPNFVPLCSWLSGLRTALGNMTSQAEAMQTAYNFSQQELEALQAATLETCQGIEEGEAQARSLLASRLRALGGHVSQPMRRALHLGIRKALSVVGRTARWISKTCPPATSSRSASRTRRQ
jgi:hypothetical protein